MTSHDESRAHIRKEKKADHSFPQEKDMSGFLQARNQALSEEPNLQALDLGAPTSKTEKNVYC